jgi:hypothetical protein
MCCSTSARILSQLGQKKAAQQVMILTLTSVTNQVAMLSKKVTIKLIPLPLSSLTIAKTSPVLGSCTLLQITSTL